MGSVSPPGSFFFRVFVSSLIRCASVSSPHQLSYSIVPIMYLLPSFHINLYVFLFKMCFSQRTCNLVHVVQSENLCIVSHLYSVQLLIGLAAVCFLFISHGLCFALPFLPSFGKTEYLEKFFLFSWLFSDILVFCCCFGS